MTREEKALEAYMRVGKVLYNKTSPHWLFQDISTAQLKALFVIKKCQSCTLSELANELGIGTSAASLLVDRLLLSELAFREEDKADRRKICIKISQLGETMINDFTQPRKALLLEWFKKLPKEQLSVLTSGMEFLAEIAEK